MNHCGECYYWKLTSAIIEPNPSGKCTLDNTLDESWGFHAGQMACRQFRKEDKMAKHSLNNGVPDCPECGGKGMCDLHKREFLKWEYEKARNEYFAEIDHQLSKVLERINQNE